MKIYTIIIAIVSLIGGIFWSFKSDFEYEPIILVVTSLVGSIYGIFFMKGNEDINSTNVTSNITSDLNIRNSNVNDIANNSGNSSTISINIGNQQNPIKEKDKSSQIDIDGEDFIEHLKRKLKILFIDDDSEFNIVKILKSSGWSKTSSIVDVKNLNMSSVKDSDILFIDIRGVGKAMNLQGEGLDLALIIKQKYPEKKVVIYSANSSSNSFHDAWKIIDDRLMKNALPIEFENIIIEYGKKNHYK